MDEPPLNLLVYRQAQKSQIKVFDQRRRSPASGRQIWILSYAKPGRVWHRTRAGSQGQLFDTLEAAALHQPLKHSSQMAWRRVGSSTVAVAGGISAKASEMPPVGRFIFAPVESSRRQGANGIGQMVLGNPAIAPRAIARASESAREAAPRPGTTACAGQRGLAGRCRRSDGEWRGITRSSRPSFIGNLGLFRIYLYRLTTDA